MQKEIFKDVIGYEGLYQVSNLGNVKSLKRTIYNKGINKNCILNDKILKQNKVGHGYNAVMLYKINCKVKSMQIHKLVAIAFLNHCPDGFKIVIDHKDNNKLNNHIDNLQIINHRQNCSKDQKKHNRSSQFIGVDWMKNDNLWRARILINKKRIYLGVFKTEIEAHLAYEKAYNELINGMQSGIL